MKRKLLFTFLPFLAVFTALFIFLGIRFNSPEGGRIILNSGRIVAVPDLGYRFSSWEGGGDEPLSLFSLKSYGRRAEFVPDPKGFPAIIINTDGGKDILSKEVYLECTVGVMEDGELTESSARIKGRGNSTFIHEKKPYKIKFYEKTSLFGETKAKEWTLLANHMDYTLSRNYLAYSVAEELDALRYTTSVRFVAVYLNGEYRGIYTLCEQIEVAKGRVEIEEDLGSVDTGYLLELDARAPEEGERDRDYFYASVSSQPYAIKSPDTEDGEFTDEHLKFIKNYVNSAYSALDSGSWERVTEYLDVASFVDGYILDELFKPVDVGYSSFYIYKDAGGKLSRGPVWDYDLSSANTDLDSANAPTSLYSKSANPFYSRLLGYEEFKALVRERLCAKLEAIEARLATEFSYIRAHEDELSENFTRWRILGKYKMNYTGKKVTRIKTYKGQIDYLEGWLSSSLASLLEVYGGEG